MALRFANNDGTDAAYSEARARRALAELLTQPVTPAAPYQLPAWELPGPGGQPAAAWPYVSTRLAVEWLPNCSLWAAEAVSIGPTVFYRLTPTVLHWLTLAGRVLDHKFANNQVDRQQCEVFADTIAALYAFAARHIDPEACERASDVERPELPEHGGPR